MVTAILRCDFCAAKGSDAMYFAMGNASGSDGESADILAGGVGTHKTETIPPRIYAVICKLSTTHKRISKPMGFKIASSGDCQNSQVGCASNFGARLGGSLAPKRVSKPMVFKIASSGDFQNS